MKISTFACEMANNTNKYMLKACLFDLDGVVFDTEPQYTEFWGSQCRLYHPERPGLEHEIKGSTLDQILGRWWSGSLESERRHVVHRLNAFEAQMRFNYVPDFIPFVVDLRQHGVRTAVVTSSNNLKMQAVYRQRPEFVNLFDAIYTSEDFSESKPSPQCYQLAAHRFVVLPQECLVFEDSINGLKSGRAAEMGVVALTTTNPLERVVPYSDYQIPDYTNINFDLLQIIWQVI